MRLPGTQTEAIELDKECNRLQISKQVQIPFVINHSPVQTFCCSRVAPRLNMKRFRVILSFPFLALRLDLWCQL